MFAIVAEDVVVVVVVVFGSEILKFLLFFQFRT